MGSHRIFSVFLLSCFLVLFVSSEFGAEVVMGTMEDEVFVTPIKESAVESRKMKMEVVEVASVQPPPKDGSINFKIRM